ncbi:prephenate dehydrogenase [Paraferrimonas haliotis]|uniref:Prephenate dehydrogenase n=1 Tax=Paraferrimonas haliotis TaxID=2013866 RepID=A0AA37TV32_9GAMM|nr:prephenate dehydrogenase [Paraferrimonas haliotis]GLS82406.1 hypothetical protein GCM10007894_03830 [Paraferrimonas haliotis]
MAQHPVLAQLRSSLQTAYRQAHDADKTLDQLSQNGHAKFEHIFKSDQGFTTESKRFMPYLEEIVSQYDRLEQQPTLDNQKLQWVVTQLGLLLQTLAQLKQNLK